MSRYRVRLSSIVFSIHLSDTTSHEIKPPDTTLYHARPTDWNHTDRLGERHNAIPPLVLLRGIFLLTTLFSRLLLRSLAAIARYKMVS